MVFSLPMRLLGEHGTKALCLMGAIWFFLGFAGDEHILTMMPLAVLAYTGTKTLGSAIRDDDTVPTRRRELEN